MEPLFLRNCWNWCGLRDEGANDRHYGSPYCGANERGNLRIGNKGGNGRQQMQESTPIPLLQPGEQQEDCKNLRRTPLHSRDDGGWPITSKQRTPYVSGGARNYLNRKPRGVPVDLGVFPWLTTTEYHDGNWKASYAGRRVPQVPPLIPEIAQTSSDRLFYSLFAAFTPPMDSRTKRQSPRSA